MTATAIAGVVGAPLSSALLKLEGAMGLAWVAVVVSSPRAVPTILMGISVLLRVAGPSQGCILAFACQRRTGWRATLQRDRDAGGSERNAPSAAMRSRLPMVWVLAGIFLLDSSSGSYTVNLWMPLLLNSFIHVGQGPGGASHHCAVCDGAVCGGCVDFWW